MLDGVRIREECRSQNRQFYAAHVAPVVERALEGERAGGVDGAVGGAGAGVGPTRAYAGGGMVSGPGGVDRVPAMLTAGEFVIRRPAVQQLGAAFLSALNRSSPTNPRPVLLSGSPAARSTSITNNVGGVTVHVTQVGEVAGVLRDLQFRESALRTRRG